MSEILHDPETQEEAEERELHEAAALPGATFRSVFGPRVYDAARRELSFDALGFAWSRRDRAAVWPSYLVAQIWAYAQHDLAHELPGAPDPDHLDREHSKAQNFVLAYEAKTGVALHHPARRKSLSDEARAEILSRTGPVRLSTHARLERAGRVPPGSRHQAAELVDEGVCEYTESAIRLGERMARGERDREDRQSKPVRFPGPRQEVR